MKVFRITFYVEKANKKYGPKFPFIKHTKFSTHVFRGGPTLLEPKLSCIRITRIFLFNDLPILPQKRLKKVIPSY